MFRLSSKKVVLKPFIRYLKANGHTITEFDNDIIFGLVLVTKQKGRYFLFTHGENPVLEATNTAISTKSRIKCVLNLDASIRVSCLVKEEEFDKWSNSIYGFVKASDYFNNGLSIKGLKFTNHNYAYTFDDTGNEKCEKITYDFISR